MLKQKIKILIIFIAIFTFAILGFYGSNTLDKLNSESILGEVNYSNNKGSTLVNSNVQTEGDKLDSNSYYEPTATPTPSTASILDPKTFEPSTPTQNIIKDNKGLSTATPKLNIETTCQNTATSKVVTSTPKPSQKSQTNSKTTPTKKVTADNQDKPSSTKNPETPKPTAKPTIKPSTPPTNISSGKKVLGFTTFYHSKDKTSYNSMERNKDLLDEIAAHSPVTDGLGNITFDYLSEDQVRFANANNITPYVLIGNNFNGEIANTLLRSPKNRMNFINNLINLMKHYNYKGVNIDLEGIYASNRDDYTQFMKEVYNALKPLNYVVTTSVPAKTYDNPKNSWNGAYDYAAIAKYADKVVLMAYDEHWSGGHAGPVASYDWVKKVLDFATSVIPNDKIYLGIAAYGYDWYEGGSKAYGITGVYNIANKYNAKVVFDNISRTPYVKYYDDNGIFHELWFENAQSLSHKLDLVNDYNIAGVAIWRLGLENNEYMDMIQNKLK